MTETRIVEWNGPEILAEYRRAGARALLVAAEYLLSLAVQQVPLDEGTLQDSGVATVDTEKMQAAVSFDTKYAVEQHENLLFRHQQGRKAKYLEDPQNQHRTEIFKVMAARYKRELRQ